jgi:hypothetical protein
MLKFSMNRRCMVFTVLFVLLAVSQTYGQVQIGGDFMFRAYSEKFFDTRDNRGGLNYMRLLGKLNLDAPIGDLGLFHADLVTISDNPVYPSRSLSGIGPLRYGISQIYGEVTALSAR